MWVVTIFAGLLVTLSLVYYFKEDFCEAFPITISFFILILYVLAFFRKLYLIDYFSLAFVLVFSVILLFFMKERRKVILVQFTKTMIHPQTITIFVVMFLVTFFVKEQIITWWDDLNYWATDTKALYYLSGFADKYGNVAPEFGDYPPGVQLFKWWFIHINAKYFDEGFLFAGYYCLNFILLLPLIKRLKTKNYLYQMVWCTALLLIPGIVSNIYFIGTCADITMGIVYGALLWAIWDYKGHTRSFYYVRITGYLCLIVLTKSVGMEWAFFGVLFLIIYHQILHKKENILFESKYKITISIILIMALTTQFSWLLFCYTRRRVARLTSAGIKIAVKGNYEFLCNTGEKIKYFLEGFSFYPMHTDKTWGIDLSSLMILGIFLIVVLILYKKKLIQQFESWMLLLFILLTALLCYGIIFIGHITIFAGELQYLDSSVMAISISRYGAPFTLGGIYLLYSIILSRTSSKRVNILCLLGIILTTNLPGAFHAIYGYRDTLWEQQLSRDQMIEEDAEKFLSLTQTRTELWGKRVLYLRNDNVIHWVKDTYINFEASPIAVVYGGVDTKNMTEDDMFQKIKESHALYLYVDEVIGDPTPLFKEMIQDNAFEYGVLYQINMEEGNIQLTKMKGPNAN